MTEAVNIRQERIERLLKELEYEITRGMMEGEIGETLGFQFTVPISKAIPDGVVACRFETRPMVRGAVMLADPTPRLRVIQKEGE